MSDSLLLLGSSIKALRTSTLKFMAPNACAGLAAGMGAINPKKWVCEDSVLLARLDDGGWLAAVADAHQGGLSGEVVVGAALDAWRRSTQSAPAARLSQAVYAIDERLRERGPDTSETTALLVHLHGSMLSWASLGDSVLWVLDDQGASEMNEPRQRFMGWRPTITPPVAGSVELCAGDVVLLASDGILAATSELEPGVVAEWLRDPAATLEQRVERLLRHMSNVGKDNLGVVVLEG